MSLGLGNLPALACPILMLPCLAFLVLCCSALVSAGELKLNRLFSDHAVLQAGESAVYGKARPGAKVSVALGEAKAEAVAGADGVFRTTLKGLKFRHAVPEVLWPRRRVDFWEGVSRSVEDRLEGVPEGRVRWLLLTSRTSLELLRGRRGLSSTPRPGRSA